MKGCWGHSCRDFKLKPKRWLVILCLTFENRNQLISSQFLTFSDNSVFCGDPVSVENRPNKRAYFETRIRTWTRLDLDADLDSKKFLFEKPGLDFWKAGLEIEKNRIRNKDSVYENGKIFLTIVINMINDGIFIFSSLYFLLVLSKRIIT
jgi:hypothetical protein